ncbi:MAG: alpha/beta fold hydrolase [Leptospiraceae bacterium]|nr:alpha/beta fold hydrolase [Leptospiraceae bacterium]
MATRLYRNRQGLQIEYRYDDGGTRNQARNLVVMLPCGGGNIRGWRYARNKLAAARCAVLQMNPRSHGQSEGQYHFKRVAEDLAELIQYLAIEAKSVQIVAHSMSAIVALQYACLDSRVWALELIAPILNPRNCLQYMYARDTIDEFLELLLPADSRPGQPTGTTPARHQVDSRQALSASCWMDRDVWLQGWRQQLHIAVANQQIKLPSIADFLEHLFIDDQDHFQMLSEWGATGKAVHIWLPAEDHWVDLHRLRSACQDTSITVTTIPEARSHFFEAGWNSFWQMLHLEPPD